MLIWQIRHSKRSPYLCLWQPRTQGLISAPRAYGIGKWYYWTLVCVDSRFSLWFGKDCEYMLCKYLNASNKNISLVKLALRLQLIFSLAVFVLYLFQTGIIHSNCSFVGRTNIRSELYFKNVAISNSIYNKL